VLDTTAVIIALISTVLGAFGSLFLKKGSKKFNLNIFEQIKNTHLILGIILFFFSILFYVFALRAERLSLIYPLTSFTYIWVALISIKFLGEKMNKYKWIGIVLIMLGIFLVGYFSA